MDAASAASQQVLAAWVQAFGSIGAILAAIGIANKQTRDDRKHIVQADIDAHKAFVALFDYVAESFSSFGNMVLEDPQVSSDAEFQKSERAFTYAFDVWHKYPAASIRSEIFLHAFVNTRGIYLDNVHWLNRGNLAAEPGKRKDLVLAIQSVQHASAVLRKEISKMS